MAVKRTGSMDSSTKKDSETLNQTKKHCPQRSVGQCFPIISFDRNRFSKVTRFVHIVAAVQAAVI